MKSRIADPGVIAALNHREVLAWLRAQGWQVRDTMRDVAHVLVRRDGEGPELIVPARATVGDYGPRMAELLATLADFQDRPVSGVESMQSCGVHYAANEIASSSFAGRKPG